MRIGCVVRRVMPPPPPFGEQSLVFLSASYMITSLTCLSVTTSCTQTSQKNEFLDKYRAFVLVFFLIFFHLVIFPLLFVTVLII